MREGVTVTGSHLIAALVAGLLVATTGVWGQPSGGESRKEALEQADFYLIPRPNYHNSYWIIDQKDNEIVGYGPWDAVKRRWTLFNLMGQYQGFIQATIGTTDPPYFNQYLWYDKENRYKGVFVASLGGRPTTPDLPYGELGGNLDIYDKGHVPLQLPSLEVEVDPFRLFPEGMDVEPIHRLPGK